MQQQATDMDLSVSSDFIVMVWRKTSNPMYENFEKLMLEFYHNGDFYGLEKYWAFHHYWNPDTGPVDKHPELERLLREEFWTLDDFKAKEKTHEAAEKQTGGSSSTVTVARGRT